MFNKMNLIIHNKIFRTLHVIVVMVLFHCGYAQYEDKSYLKKGDSALAVHLSKYIPESKFGPVVTPLNLTEAVKNPTYYKSARFSNANLTEFPEQLFLFPYLEEIDLSHNAIKVIPQNVNAFKTLRELHINANQITSLGAEITKCPMLEVLQIQNNPLEKISNEIGTMHSLREITIGEITSQCTVPPSLWTLTNLRKIKITNSHLTEIPVSIVNIKQLNELCLANNSITQLPNELFGLKNLTYLNLGYNKINNISASIKEFKNLTYLGVYYNPIVDLPLDVIALEKLKFLSCWQTSIPQTKIEQLKNAMPLTLVHETETGIH